MTASKDQKHCERRSLLPPVDLASLPSHWAIEAHDRVQYIESGKMSSEEATHIIQLFRFLSLNRSSV